MWGVILIICCLNMILNVGIIIMHLEREDHSYEIIDQLDYITRMEEQQCKMLGKDGR